jgi:transposase
MNKVIGIDISKATFDVGFLKGKIWIHQIFSNDLKGFKSLKKLIDSADHCVMEASGPYYLQLAMFMYSKGIKVSVVNPLVIKRFAQMRLMRAKTDKKDAQIIAEYGMKESPKLWSPEDKHIIHMRQMFTAIQNIDKQINMSSKQLGAFEATGMLCNDLKSTLKGLIKTLKLKKEKLQVQLISLTKEHYQQTFERLQTIPGLGPKTAVLLTTITNNFQKFEHSRQLIAYVGLSPRVYQSGTSIKGKGHICKMGNSVVRKQLYMCSWTAKFCNKGCRQMYDRLKEKGKPERVIKIAIANKLLKQAFAVIKNDMDFNENYAPKPCF